MKKHCIITLFFLAALQASAVNGPIVNWGSDFGSGMMRGGGRLFVENVDVDGDGKTSDDCVSAWAFSLDKPLNPTGLCYDTDAPSSTFYGGMTLYTANNKRRISEGHYNTNHEGRDDLNFMANFRPAIASNELTAGYALIVWQKEDFLNQANEKTVSFNSDSTIDVHISRYWAGVDAGHWVVRDGDQFYVSEKIFGDLRKQFNANKQKGQDGGNNEITRTTHTLHPTESKWAVYNPSEPFHIEFDYKTADFKEHEFKNVTSVGFLVARDLSQTKPCATNLRLGEPIGVKWYAFRCTADITDIDPMNRLLAMKPVGAFSMSESEITYAQWQTIRRNVLSNQLVLPGGKNPAYIMEHGDGQMGSMILGDGKHSADEPVSNISWIDAVAFCNALSEFEGLTPCYTADAAHTKVLRIFRNRSHTERLDERPTLYWNKKADGYRLPTRSEWALAAGKKSTPVHAGRTQPVKSGEANQRGLFDMMGNVWEYVWDVGTSANLETVKKHTVLGGDYRSSKSPNKTDLPFSENAFDGSHRIGFRVVRGPAAEISPDAIASVPSWTIKVDSPLEPAKAMDVEDLLELVQNELTFVPTEAGCLTSDNAEKYNLSESQNASKFSETYPLYVGTTEIPYSIWTAVRLWAETEGYEFNYPGDMGSMASQTGRHTHSPDEPVTMVSLYDAVIWCNALSELAGNDPVYCADAAKTEPLRHALQFRNETQLEAGYPQWSNRSWAGYKPHTESWIAIHVNGEANGYRVPLLPEYALLTETRSDPLPYEWLADNSDGTTHAVATRTPSAAGLYDLEGNVMEWVWGKRAPGFGLPRQLGHFANHYRKGHPNLDRKDFPFSARAYCGFRACHR